MSNQATPVGVADPGADHLRVIDEPAIAVNDLRRHLAPLQAELDVAITRVVGSAWYVMGTELTSFEAAFADYCGADHAIGVASGTDALELALKAVGVESGSRVVTVANAGMYASAAILACGARPVYVDVDDDTLLLDPEELDALLRTVRPAAVVVTHLYGQLADMEGILAVTRPLDVPVVEDCAQAHGARRDGRAAGTFADAGTFSFYPTKNLGAIGDGGAVVTGHATIAERVRRLRQYGWSAKYVADTPHGRNSRLDELQAAALNALLPRLDGWNARRREVIRRYGNEITHPGIRPLVRAAGDGAAADDETADVGHLAVVRTPYRDHLRQHLRERGIAGDVHFPVPDHRQRAVRAVTGGHPELPVTEKACGEVLSLPCFPELSDSEIDRVVREVNQWQSPS